MATNPEHAPTTPAEPVTDVCDLTLDEHVEVAISALTMFGQGIGCQKTYQALLVIAELARRRHGHAPFDPAEMVEEYMRGLQEAEAEDRLAEMGDSDVRH